MSTAKKASLLGLGGLSALLIISQFLLGRMLVAGMIQYRTAHQHTGYLTVAVVLVYLIASIITIARLPKREASAPPRS